MSTLISETRLPNGMKIFCLQKDEAQLMYQEVQNYLKYGIQVKEGDTVFDVGANIGLFTIWLSKKFNHKINIYAFEPIPDIYEVLNANVQRFIPENFRLFACGLSLQPGNVKFTYYPNMTLGSTAYPITEKAEIDKLQEISIANFQHFPAPISWLRWLPYSLFSRIINHKLNTAFQGKEVNGKLKTISEIIREHQIEQIDLLKIDVEKSELDVILGIEAEDWKKIKQVFVEVHNLDFRLDKISKLLKDKGFANITVEQEPILNGSDIFSLYAW
ncbi:FkbM family methyltransferase [Anabaena sphaerica FACHB-251]|uniref:FkbM family methyltransferase n=1 Tax=Anabaena sphaerica FACHB-251 TaxID=2692883 RepID=A0A927A2I4_9NOST|nr:FkbM family methyltransferase [Anabaena sphaerica]MBD2295418.1 FkbM family methyltransferase [Anabaena sphaerica FACHB-251]